MQSPKHILRSWSYNKHTTDKHPYCVKHNTIVTSNIANSVSVYPFPMVSWCNEPALNELTSCANESMMQVYSNIYHGLIVWYSHVRRLYKGIFLITLFSKERLLLQAGNNCLQFTKMFTLTKWKWKRSCWITACNLASAKRE